MNTVKLNMVVCSCAELQVGLPLLALFKGAATGFGCLHLVGGRL